MSKMLPRYVKKEGGRGRVLVVSFVSGTSAWSKGISENYLLRSTSERVSVVCLTAVCRQFWDP